MGVLPMVTDDAITVRAALSFDSFYRTNYRQVLCAVYGLAGPGAAEDVTQEAFLAASRRWEEVRLLDNPRAWVRRVALNRAASAYQRRRAEARAVIRLSARREGSIPALSEPAEEVWKAVRSLPRRQREAIVLCLVGDYSRAEAAEIMTVSVETVKTHLERGRRALAEILKEALE